MLAYKIFLYYPNPQCQFQRSQTYENMVKNKHVAVYPTLHCCTRKTIVTCKMVAIMCISKSVICVVIFF